MTSRNLARHRKAARPLTPLSDATPALRRGLVVAASSGLALTMITSAANAAGGNTQSLERSAGALGIGPATAKAEALITQNTPIEVDADVVADADTPATSEVATEAPGPSEEELAAQAAAEAQAQAEQAAAEAQAQAQAQAQAEQAAAEAQAQAAPAVSTEDDAEPTAAPASSSVPQGAGSDAVAIGSNYLGTPYAWGGGAPGGFDCSGFVSYVYAQMGISLPHQSGDILNSGTVISASEARPGDILWWPGHVGIYAGNGQVLHSTPGPGVSITNIWGSPTYLRVG